MLNVTKLLELLDAIDAAVDKDDQWGYYRSEMIKVHNRQWYGYNDYNTPSDATVLHSLQDDPDGISAESGTYSITRIIKAWYGKAEPVLEDLVDGKFPRYRYAYNIYQRYGLSLMDFLHSPPQILTAIDQILTEELNRGK